MCVISHYQSVKVSHSWCYVSSRKKFTITSYFPCEPSVQTLHLVMRMSTTEGSEAARVTVVAATVSTISLHGTVLPFDANLKQWSDYAE